jgi:hypothetical protein
MTERINFLRCSPLDLAVKQALIEGESVESVAARLGLAVPGEAEQPHDGDPDP